MLTPRKWTAAAAAGVVFLALASPAQATRYKVILRCLSGSSEILAYPLTFSCQFKDFCFGFDCNSTTMSGVLCSGGGKMKVISPDIPACGSGCEHLSLIFNWYCDGSWEGSDCIPVPGSTAHTCRLGGGSAILKVKPVRE